MSLWLDRNWSPLLLKEKKEPFNSKDYLFEVKFDGLRACVFVGVNDFTIINRHRKDITYLYPELQEIQKLVNENTIFDGEIISMEKGNPSFSKLQERAHLKDKNKIKIHSRINPVIFVAFDILYQGKDLINKKLIDRKKILDKIGENEYFIKSKVFENQGIQLFELIKKKNLEGIVAKRKDSGYSINARSGDWIKIKNLHVEEFLIGGYEEKKNGSISLLLGEIINNKLLYVGSVILFSTNSFYWEVLHCKKNNKSPFINYEREGATYLFPKLTCKVKYMERTKNNHIRQPFIVKSEKTSR